MTARHDPWRLLALLAGLAVGPGIWALSTQLGQILPYAECGASIRPSTIFAGLGALLSLGSAWLSWRGAAGLRKEEAMRFTGQMAALMGLLFAFALLLQAAATLVLSGCER
ncbi:hypothetical protein EBE87_14945 [Pseudoroseomonas wenyumeiae]|uniref:Uncharacterized protein n=1 Tax=Teichococcus wenyumeiae TaxID=2478470 RepID=A0A3A9JG18_9PROT|nr:hypothetical protein [Pseudoroseomonas wenyumeiae]RKK05522.1 hypothetical protein D6Z83_03710 [Pseudoroseomonas wenyumeiae]RMI20748.1 hypothetical protein EBE87_14945 [Pseudoroseomonas wenyumeiae]